MDGRLGSRGVMYEGREGWYMACTSLDTWEYQTEGNRISNTANGMK
jgi:hypothetical protein